MFCSRPVLSTDAGCSKKIISKYGFIIKKNDYFSIIEGIKISINFIINKKIKWQIMQNKAGVYVKKNFSVERMADNYLKSWIF